MKRRTWLWPLLGLSIHGVACDDGGETRPDAGDTQPVGDTGDTQAPGDTGDTDEVGPAPLCSPEHGPVPAVGTDDATYTSWTTYGCLGSKARLCQSPPPRTLMGLLECDAVEGGWYWEQGSTAFRVAGREDGKCKVEVVTEVEGGGGIYTCRLPLPMTPWAGLELAPGGEILDAPLEGIAEHCTLEGQCSLLSGGPDECWDLSPRPPLCQDFAARGGRADP